MVRLYGSRWGGPGSVLGPLVAAAALLLMAACNGPQAPSPGGAPADLDATYRQGTLEFLLTSGGNVTSLMLVADSFEFDSATNHLSAQVAVRNDGSETVPGPQSIVVFGFVPAGVAPVNAVCEADDSPARPAGCAFDHRGTYGDDGLLSPGETSTPVQWIFLDPGEESFAFRARIGPGAAGPGSIAGIVFEDLDRDGERDAGEPGLANVTVRLRGTAGPQTTPTDAQGHYLFVVSEPGILSVDLALPLPGGLRPTAPLPLSVTILRRPDGSLTHFALADIGLAGAASAADVRVQGRVYEDENRNGRYDAGERGIPGVTIEGRAGHDDAGDDGEDEHDARAVSDAEGLYSLVLPGGAGPWEIHAESVDGFDRTTSKRMLFTLPPAAGEALHADFGYAREEAWSHYEVHGTVYLDSNRNGRRDPTEVGVEDVLMRAGGTTCDALADASEATNSHGRYSLEGADVRCGLPWIVSRAAPAGYEGTTPGSVQLDAPPVNEDTFTVDFGLAPVISIGP